MQNSLTETHAQGESSGDFVFGPSSSGRADGVRLAPCMLELYRESIALQAKVFETTLREIYVSEAEWVARVRSSPIAAAKVHALYNDLVMDALGSVLRNDLLRSLQARVQSALEQTGHLKPKAVSTGS